jgi:hypothetical protein
MIRATCNCPAKQFLKETISLPEPKSRECPITGQTPSGYMNELQAQFSRKLHLWQGGHEIAEKSSNIVPRRATYVSGLFSITSICTL